MTPGQLAAAYPEYNWRVENYFGTRHGTYYQMAGHRADYNVRHVICWEPNGPPDGSAAPKIILREAA